MVQPAGVLAVGPCVCCREPFTFNPVAVPSIIVDGERQPICRRCVTLVNPLRDQAGMPRIEPRPDAYDACDPDELDP